MSNSVLDYPYYLDYKLDYKIEDIKFIENAFKSFFQTGSISSGGVTRLGYSKEEDEMHDIFFRLAKDIGCQVFSDKAGNSFATNDINAKNYYLIGSHLDSVVDGGRYDGVAGIIAGLFVLKHIKNIPIKVGAFRSEESSNFGTSMIGSKLITDENFRKKAYSLTNKQGINLKKIFEERNLSFDMDNISGIKQYIELHIEQGKVLEEENLKVGIVTKIAGPKRFKIHIYGNAEHSGATPMGMRTDALCAASEIILEIEKMGKEEAKYDSVATVGIIDNMPNVMNVIPGEVSLGVDIRGIDEDSLERCEKRLKTISKQIEEKRKVTILREKTSDTKPVAMNDKIIKKLSLMADKLKIPSKIMPSGAGHDAGNFTGICETGMIFIPCKKGISHNKKEFSSIENIIDGSNVLLEYFNSVEFN